MPAAEALSAASQQRAAREPQDANRCAAAGAVVSRGSPVVQEALPHCDRYKQDASDAPALDCRGVLRQAAAVASQDAAHRATSALPVVERRCDCHMRAAPPSALAQAHRVDRAWDRSAVRLQAKRCPATDLAAALPVTAALVPIGRDHRQRSADAEPAVLRKHCPAVCPNANCGLASFAHLQGAAAHRSSCPDSAHAPADADCFLLPTLAATSHRRRGSVDAEHVVPQKDH